jgi:GMP synthase (glutamine-hydrolysing)
MLTRPALVLQHVPWERPGLIGDALADAAVPIETRTVLDDHTPALPAPADLAALVVMGGPMGALDDAVHPGLAAERHLIATCVAADVPVLGVCLGMQLLAVALDAELHTAHGTEIGFDPIEVVTPDPLLAPLGPNPAVLHWHGDAVDLPSGATLLARSSLTPVQAFRAGSATGLQFHLEVDRPLLTDWLDTAEMFGELTTAGVTDLPEQAATVLPTLTSAALTGLTSFAARARDRA